MAKNLLLKESLKAVPVNFISKSTDVRMKNIQRQQFIKKNYSINLSEPVKKSNLEINIDILDCIETDALNIHLFGVDQNDVLLERYHDTTYLLASNHQFTYMDLLNDVDDFLVSRVAFSATTGEITLSASVQEPFEEDAVRFLNENGS